MLRLLRRFLSATDLSTFGLLKRITIASKKRSMDNRFDDSRRTRAVDRFAGRIPEKSGAAGPGEKNIHAQQGDIDPKNW